MPEHTRAPGAVSPSHVHEVTARGIADVLGAFGAQMRFDWHKWRPGAGGACNLRVTTAQP